MTGSDLSSLLKKHPIGVACTVIALASGVFLYLRWDDIGESQKKYDQQAAEADKVAANVRNLPNLPEQVVELQTATKELEARLMKAGQLAANLQYFYKLEAENGVKLVDVRQNNAGRSATPRLYAPVPFSVTVQGSYTQVMNFLVRLQNGRHFCRINSATFSKANGGAEEMTLALSLELLGQS